MSSTIDVVAAPLTFPFSGKTTMNRTLKSAMTEHICTYTQDVHVRGKPTEAYAKLYDVWGKGRIGVIVLGNIPVHRDHIEGPGNMVIDIQQNQSWDAVEALKPVISNAKKTGSLVLGQLTHGGKQAYPVDRSSELLSGTKMSNVSASDNPAFEGFGHPLPPSRAMTHAEVKTVISHYAKAAKVLYDAGADGAQLHAAHGYLLSQFLSPVTNHRTDEYGGSFENRCRIIFEIYAEIRKLVPDESFMLTIKINSHDYIEGGFTADDCKEIVERLEAARIDLIELSGGTYESFPDAMSHKSESTKRREAYFIEFAEQITPHVQQSKIVVTGGWRNIEPMARAISEKTCDMIGLGRPLCTEPDLVDRLLKGDCTGAKGCLVPLALQTPAGIIELHCMGEDRPLIDWSTEEGANEITEMIMGKRPKRPDGEFEYPEA